MSLEANKALVRACYEQTQSDRLVSSLLVAQFLVC